MKHFIILSILALSSQAYANNGIYTSVKLGVSDSKFQDTEFDAKSNYLENYEISDKDLNIFPTLSAAVGFDFNSISNINARAELEYSYKDENRYSSLVTSADGSDISSNNIIVNHKIKSQSLMLNGYFDFKNKSKFTPYINVGAGVTRLDKTNTYAYNPNIGHQSNSLSNSNHDNLFTWSAGAGVSYKVNKNVDLDISYKYVDAGKYKFNSSIEQAGYANNYETNLEGKLTSNDYSLGIRYNF